MRRVLHFNNVATIQLHEGINFFPWMNPMPEAQQCWIIRLWICEACDSLSTQHDMGLWLALDQE